MTDGSPRTPGPKDPGTPAPINGPPWVIILGSVFGGITLLGLFVFGYLASANPQFVCNSFVLLNAIFAFGAGLSAAFIGGGAAATGQIGGAPGAAKTLVFSVGGGVAVFFIAFFAFQLLKPSADACSSRRVELQFQDVPSELIATVQRVFSRRETDDALRKQEISIRVENGSGRLVLSAQKDGSTQLQPVCSINLSFVSSLTDVYEPEYRFADDRQIPTDGLIPFTYSSPPAKSGVKASVPRCFAHKGTPVVGLLITSLTENKIRIADAPNPKVSSGDDLASAWPMPQSFGTVFSGDVGLIGTAFAQGSSVSFEELKQRLSSPNDQVRVQARNYLSRQFGDYRDAALQDLFSSQTKTGPYLASLLSGVIAWIDTATNGRLTPGLNNRDLSTPLPEGIAGKEKQLINFTGHPDDSVKKQARRLVQRYPVDSFLMIYLPLVEQAASGKCLNPTANLDEEAILYSSIFFFYNRVVSFNNTLSAKNISEAQKYIQLVHAAAKQCLSSDLAVDAALVDFGLATILELDKTGNYKDKAKLAAQTFLKIVSGHEGDYYYPGHIDAMKRVAGS
jgi:hypothetical protein